MGISVNALIQGVQETQLNDVEKVTWTEAILLSALNQAIALLVLVRPDATAKFAQFSCVAGSRQNLPSDAIRLLKVVRNTNGRAVRLVNQHDLDAINPDWHSMAQAAIIREYMFDDRTPKWFYVYPPAQNGVTLEIEYSAAPNEITDINTVINIDLVFQQPLQEFMLYKLLSGDGGQGQGMQNYNTGMQLLGAKPSVDKYSTPINPAKPATGVTR